MRRAHLIIGFSSWGKSFMIHQLMGKNPNGRPSYRMDRTYEMPFIGRRQTFVVQSQSNDDLDREFLENIETRLANTEDERPDLLVALCPARERRESMVAIMADPVWRRFDEFHFYLLEYKWDGQAKLMLPVVERHVVEIGVHSFCYSIIGLNLVERCEQVREGLRIIYGL
jgi:hypothetical protein